MGAIHYETLGVLPDGRKAIRVAAIVQDGRACGPDETWAVFYIDRRDNAETEAVRLFFQHIKSRGQSLHPNDDNVPEHLIYEAPCGRCGSAVLTDEWLKGEPYWPTECECGGRPQPWRWVISSEPHPATLG